MTANLMSQSGLCQVGGVAFFVEGAGLSGVILFCTSRYKPGGSNAGRTKLQHRFGFATENEKRRFQPAEVYLIVAGWQV